MGNILSLFIITVELYPNTECCTRAYQQSTKKKASLTKGKIIIY
jgi:hypothetical protein